MRDAVEKMASCETSARRTMTQTARLHVGLVEEMEKRFGDAWQRLERGEKVACAMRMFSHRFHRAHGTRYASG